MEILLLDNRLINNILRASRDSARYPKRQTVWRLYQLSYLLAL